MASVTFNGDPVTLIGTEVKEGDQAPNFTALDTGMQAHSLDGHQGKVRVISVVPSVDTGVCAQQTRRFNEEAAELDNVEVLTVSVDLPFAQKRWCAAEGIDNLTMLSDHRDFSFGEAFGIGIQEMRLLARGVFVLDSNGKVTHAEYVSEATEHPDYDAAISAAKETK
ncbi:thiol peroxidase [Salicibibacter halophilus]|uniref:Thiol peroxidase n=1 Tax=Salicibibacter halophilus TaxID=2502791 RepID=A0A514LMH1_9BACI|nr:thiol peroxidase [Salicibibacter halophilus]QDI93059.1 thiol peroxidase [Salicibibacter halophilus]